MRDRQTERQRDRYKETDRKREGERETERDRHKERKRERVSCPFWKSGTRNPRPAVGDYRGTSLIRNTYPLRITIVP